MKPKDVLKFIGLALLAAYVWFSTWIVFIYAGSVPMHWITLVLLLLIVSLTCSWATTKKPFSPPWFNHLFPFLVLAISLAILSQSQRLFIIPDRLVPM